MCSSDLREASETWGGMCYGEATSGRGSIAESVLRALMRLAAKRLMSQYRPDAPALVAPPFDTAGSGGRIMFTTTSAPAPEIEEADMPIVAAAGLVSTVRARIAKGVDWYEDANLSRRGGSFSADADVVFVGSPVGELVEGGSYAVQVNTGSIYGDGIVRATVVYVAVADADTYTAVPPSGADADEIRLERDEQWEDALRRGEAWPSA